MKTNRRSARKKLSRRKQHISRPAEIENLEDRLLLSGTEIQSIDGTENNIENPEWGSTEEQLLRASDEEYSDGIDDPAGADRASAREISNAVAAQDYSILNDRYLSDFVWQWGQFLDHDIDLTDGADPAESFPIEVPTGDPFFDPFGTGTQEIGLNRSIFDTATGDATDNPRQQLNQITAYVDGSNVYGSDEERAAALRTFEGGRLKTSDGDLLPWNEDGLENAGGTGDNLFLAGDVRANEQVGLIALHTLFVREHNRLAGEISTANPDLTDEEIYQQARSIVIAEMQNITYNEFLPALLGPNALSEYTGYDATVNPGIANEFSTAAYRFGHSMLSSELLRLDEDGNEIAAGNLALRDAFFSPDEIVNEGIEPLLLGLAAQYAQEIDTNVVDDVRNFLFGPPGSGGFDLASLNIQRGRDHGLADYNQVRTDFGLPAVTSFAQITSDPELQKALAEVYDNDVNNIDLWVGGLAEDHVPGASMGETFSAIIADQFERLRDGDRFWYGGMFDGSDLEAIQQTSLSDIIERNTDITDIQDNVFVAGGDDHGDEAALATRIDRRGETQGDIQSIGDRDMFEVQARRGMTYVFETELGTLADSTLTLYDKNGIDVLGFDDDGGEGLASRLQATFDSDGTYYLAVDSYNDMFLGSYSLKVDQQMSVGRPTLVGPIGLSPDNQPTFEWTAVPEADHYELWVNNLTTRESGVIRESNVAGTSFESPVTFNDGDRLIWTVRAVDADGNVGRWAAHSQFVVGQPMATPTLDSPVGRVSADNVEFSWSAVENADHYDLWVNDLTTGESGVIRERHIDGTSFVPETALTPGHRYLWTVRAVSESGMSGDWARHAAFTVGMDARPQIVGPQGTVDDGTPTFEWEEVPTADHYEIWVNDLTTGERNVIRETNINGTTFTPATPLEAGHRYIWTVRAVMADGGVSEWAAHRRFRVPAAESLVEPVVAQSLNSLTVETPVAAPIVESSTSADDTLTAALDEAMSNFFGIDEWMEDEETA